MAARALLVVVLAGLLSGCLSQSPATSPGAAFASEPSAPGSASLSGLVQTFAGLQLPSVDIQLEPGAFRTSTDARGAFAFPSLPAGEYRLVAERLGYAHGELDLELKPGTVHRATLTLLTAPLDQVSVHSTTFNGVVQCSANAYYPSNVCGRPLGAEQDHVLITADPSLPIGELLLELVWTPTTAATGQELEIDLCLPGAADGALNCREIGASEFHREASGTSPIVLRVPASEIPADALAFEAWVGAGYLSPYPTLAQPFTLHTTICYSAACPEGYSALSD